MKERPDISGYVTAIAIALVLLVLLVGGGVMVYGFLDRQATIAKVETMRARVAEREAMRVMERARSAMLAAAPSENATASDPSSAAIAKTLEAMLGEQTAAWNRGDLDQFMQPYWRSDELTFSSGGKTTRGWDATLQRFRKRYPTPEKMGTLHFTNLEITTLGESAALVLGTWRIEREAEPISGNFSLVIRKVDDQWKIVHDHSSRLEQDE